MALLLVPFAVADSGAVARELIGYGGVADFGWIGAWRGMRWLAGQGLGRGEASYWEPLVTVAKVLFFAAYGLVLARTAREVAADGRAGGPRRVPRPLRRAQRAVPAVGGPARAPARRDGDARDGGERAATGAGRTAGWPHTVAATAGLVGFYLFLAPGVLAPEGVEPLSRGVAGTVWLAGGTASVLVAVGWLVSLLRSPAAGETPAA